MDSGAIAALVLPTLFGTGILTWVVRGKIDEARQIREKLRAEQRERYAQILNPYVQLLANPKAQQEVVAVITSSEYRKETFDFALVADDSVLKAYIQMFERFNALQTAPDAEKVEALRSFGRLLLELRKSVGNKKTKLTEVQMLQVVGVKDAKEHLSSGAARGLLQR